MATALTPHSPSSLHRPPTIFEAPSIVLHGVPWADYEAMLRVIGDRPIFVNYDRGSMEVLVPSHHHEGYKVGLGFLAECLSEELEIPMEAGGSTTHRRVDLEKGVEPDNCYWLRAKATAMIGRDELDLSRDPAPSLVIEVNYTSSSLDRMAIYAALGVEEVWRWHKELEFLHLGDDRAYHPFPTSHNFPFLAVAEAVRWVEMARSMGRSDWMRTFRRHVREEIAPQHREAANGHQ